jgi:hypothetical protein
MRIACLVAVVSISGCVGVPLPSITLEEYIPEDSLSFLDVGLTTKDEVIEKLAEPASTYSNGSKWIYRANLRATNRWAACVYMVFDMGCERASLSRKYGLLGLDFDDRGVLSDWELSYAEFGYCSKEGVCVLDESYMIFAPESTDLAAKRIDVSGNYCAIYLYPHEGIWISYFSKPMRVQIEGVFDTWWRYSRESYLYRVLPAASYLVTTTYANQRHSIQLACNAGDVVFMRYSKNIGDGGYGLEVATESDGLAAIEHRRPILFEDITPLTSNP